MKIHSYYVPPASSPVAVNNDLSTDEVTQQALSYLGYLALLENACLHDPSVQNAVQPEINRILALYTQSGGFLDQITDPTIKASLNTAMAKVNSSPGDYMDYYTDPKGPIPQILSWMQQNPDGYRPSSSSNPDTLFSTFMFIDSLDLCDQQTPNPYKDQVDAFLNQSGQSGFSCMEMASAFLSAYWACNIIQLPAASSPTHIDPGSLPWVLDLAFTGYDESPTYVKFFNLFTDNTGGPDGVSYFTWAQNLPPGEKPEDALAGLTYIFGNFFNSF